MKAVAKHCMIRLDITGDKKFKLHFAYGLQNISLVINDHQNRKVLLHSVFSSVNSPLS